MLEFASRSELLQQVRNWQQQQQTLALVPTMGNLHAGHLSLIETARRHASIVITSLFVNPTQFGQNEDFGDYPRTLESDRQQLQAAGCDALFTPTTAALYPYGHDDFTRVLAPNSLTTTLCGLHRPGHFDGVTSVVARLFNLIQPQIAVFGEKDYQQLLIIQRMVADLGMPQQIIASATIREASGLAMSSRNQYLAANTDHQAAQIQQTLLYLSTQLDQGRRDIQALEQQASQQLAQIDFDVDYVAIRQASNLHEISSADELTELRILVAARLGQTRLIDNIAWSAKK